MKRYKVLMIGVMSGSEKHGLHENILHEEKGDVGQETRGHGGGHPPQADPSQEPEVDVSASPGHPDSHDRSHHRLGL